MSKNCRDKSECPGSGSGPLSGESAAVLHAAALWGARSVARHSQLVQDATQIALDRYVDMVLRGAPPREPSAWLRRVAANAARRLASRRARTNDLSIADSETSPELAAGASSGVGAAPVERVDLLRHLSGMAAHLTVRQRRVLHKMAEPNMTVAQAARDLRMDRSGLRRVFQRGLARLGCVRSELGRSHEKRPPPPSL